jgi:hypothetical protein
MNCRHNIRKEKPSGNIECVCEITNEHIGYVKCFEGWCRHWAKDNKLFVCSDQNEELEAKATDLENTEVAKSFEEAVRQKLFEASWVTFPSNEFFKDMARLYDLSYEQFLNRTIGGFKTRPIRKAQDNEQNSK